MKSVKPKPETLASKVERLFLQISGLDNRCGLQDLKVGRLAEQQKWSDELAEKVFGNVDERLNKLETKPDIEIPEPPSQFSLWLAVAILAFGVVAVSLLVYGTVPASYNQQVYLVSPPPPAINPETLTRSSGIVLSLVVKQDCWYEGDSDGQKIPGQLWHAGATRNIGGEHEVTIRSGCPGGLEYTVNGKLTLPVNESNNPKIEIVKFESQEKQ